MNAAAKRIKINEVGPRDGLQNEQKLVSTSLKLELISKLRQTGIEQIECTSFVSPKWVPQMADHEQILEQVQNLPGTFPVLIPNLNGLERFLRIADPQKTEVAVFVAASDGFSRSNTNKSVSESLHLSRELIKRALDAGFRARGYLSTVYECPFDGKTDPQRVAEIAGQLRDYGCYEVSLGDTTGTATPRDIERLLDKVFEHVSPEYLAIHAHNTFGQGVANTIRAVEMGVTTVDASVAGLGGCPFSPGATGNVCTEEIVYSLHGMGYDTGVDLKQLCAVSRWASELVGRSPSTCAAAMLNLESI